MKKDAYLLIAILSLVLVSPAFAQVTQAWLARYGEGPNSNEYAVDLAMDGDGFLYVTGSSNNNSHFATLKYDGDGTRLWTAFYNEGGYSFYARSLALDPDGNVLVSGYKLTGGGNGYDYATVKYNNLGVQQWASTSSQNPYDYAVDMAVDPDGNVYVTGFTIDDYVPEDYFTVKYNSAGIQQWAATYNGTANTSDRPAAIAVDEEGNAYVTGYSMGVGSVSDYVTIKYNPEGVAEWVARYDSPGSGYDHAGALTLDSDGNVYVAGGNWGSPSGDFTTLKYDNNGNQLWAACFDDSTTQGGTIEAITLDAEGNVIITGGIGNEGMGEVDYLTLKYNPEGVLQWEARYDGPAHYFDYASALATDPDGNVYVTGGSEQTRAQRGIYPVFDYATIKYSSQGQQEWLMRYDGSGHGDDLAVGLVLDEDENVYVTGYSGISNAGSDYVTIKYRQTTPNLTVSLVPFVLPIQIPASGGSFEFYVFADNGGPGTQVTDLWTKVILPNGSVLDPVLGPNIVALDSGVTGWIRHQNVPANAPAGSYTYVLLAGDYPNQVWSSDSLVFEKLGFGDGGMGVSDWLNTGEEFSAVEPPLVTQSSSFITHTSPNPFNPSTAISYELQASSYVSLRVYDTSGRLVTTLADGWREAGDHQVTFEGSGLPSGIYLYRLTGGNQTVSGKMVLVK